MSETPHATRLQRSRSVPRRGLRVVAAAAQSRARAGRRPDGRRARAERPRRRRRSRRHARRRGAQARSGRVGHVSERPGAFSRERLLPRGGRIREGLPAAPALLGHAGLRRARAVAPRRPVRQERERPEGVGKPRARPLVRDRLADGDLAARRPALGQARRREARCRRPLLRRVYGRASRGGDGGRAERREGKELRRPAREGVPAALAPGRWIARLDEELLVEPRAAAPRRHGLTRQGREGPGAVVAPRRLPPLASGRQVLPVPPGSEPPLVHGPIRGARRFAFGARKGSALGRGRGRDLQGRQSREHRVLGRVPQRRRRGESLPRGVRP